MLVVGLAVKAIADEADVDELALAVRVEDEAVVCSVALGLGVRLGIGTGAVDAAELASLVGFRIGTVVGGLALSVGILAGIDDGGISSSSSVRVEAVVVVICALFLSKTSLDVHSSAFILIEVV